MATSITFHLRSTMPSSAEEAFAWHERPGAFARLNPPWEPARVIEQSGGIRDGARLVMSIPLLGPLRIRWLAAHSGFIQNRQFRDVQEKGPFALWDHTHLFEPDTSRTCIMHDRIRLAPPLGRLGLALGAGTLRAKLARVFAYRHRTLSADLASHARWRDRPRQTIAISGATGLIGSALSAFLSTGGHRIFRLARPGALVPPAAAAWPSLEWDPARGLGPAAEPLGLDAVIHLAGVNVAARRWSKRFKAEILSSRVAATRALCESLARLRRPPATLLCASAIGYYSKSTPADQDESAPSGDSFLAGVCRQWEDATAPARNAGIRVANLRLGVVLSPQGGALGALLPLFRAGLGGPLGSGSQPMSWISLDDALVAALHVLMTPSLSGPVNFVAPHPVANREFASVLASVLSRPALLPAPAWALRLAVGEMADAELLAGARVIPRRLLDSGYAFRHPRLDAALAHMLGVKKGVDS